MIFIINIYSIRFEYDRVEWRDFISKKDLLYSAIKSINAFLGIKGKREYSYLEILCSTREKPCRIDTRYFDKYGKSRIIRLLSMKAPEARLNGLAISIREMRKDALKLSKVQLVSVIIVCVIFAALEMYLKFFLKNGLFR
jgi:hypothetical protein